MSMSGKLSGGRKTKFVGRKTKQIQYEQTSLRTLINAPSPYMVKIADSKQPRSLCTNPLRPHAEPTRCACCQNLFCSAKRVSCVLCLQPTRHKKMSQQASEDVQTFQAKSHRRHQTEPVEMRHLGQKSSWGKARERVPTMVNATHPSQEKN